MPTTTLTFANKINTSAQRGDTAYYVTTSSSGGFTINSVDLVKIGVIKTIATDRLSMVVDLGTLTTAQIPTTSHFILFSKDNIANMTTPMGYYAKVVLKNNSTTEAELYSIGCDTFESSK
jgi:hypothetical protein